MADLSWLRLGLRSRPPNVPRSPTTSERAPAREPQPGEHRKQDLSHIPSYLSLASRASNSPEPVSRGSDSSLLVREQDGIWYNPSLDQMVEALQVAIMTRGVLSPIPVEYNTYVLHLVEGFADSCEKVRTADAAHAGVKQSLEQNLEEFRSLVDDWLEREKRYKAEIKRLEVLLSRTSLEGLEAVTLARTNSVVDRSGPEAKAFVSRLTRLSSHHQEDMSSRRRRKPCDRRGPVIVPEPSLAAPGESSQWSLKPIDDVESRGTSEQNRTSLARKTPATEVALPKILDRDNDFLISERIERLDAAARATSKHYLKSRRRHRAWTPTKQTSKDSSAVTLRVPPTATHTFLRESCPLFSDDDLAPPSLNNESEADTQGSESGDRYVRRQMLESLLGKDDDVITRGRNLAQPLSGDLGTPTESPERPRRDLRHQRGFSSFSFVPGDDIFPASTGRMTEDREEGEKGGGGDIELRPYEQVPRQKVGGDVQGLPVGGNRSYTEFAAGLAPSMCSREGRSPRAIQKDGPSTHGSTSSTNTVVRGAQYRSADKGHESASGRYAVVRITASQSQSSPDSAASPIAERDITAKQQSETSARIAAARAVAQSKGREQDKRI